MTTTEHTPRHRDDVILAAAREVFVADAGAPMSAVADAAGVGMAALYSRYGSKEGLLRTLCADGLAVYLEEVEAALGHDDVAVGFRRFLERIVAADTHTLTTHLAGTFEPDDEVMADAARANELNERLVARAHEVGVLRDDVTAPDLAMVFEMMAAVRLGDDERTDDLRRRHLTLLLEGLRPSPDDGPLPGDPVTWEELGARWIP